METMLRQLSSRRFWIGISMLVLLILGGCGARGKTGPQASATKLDGAKYVPTLFFHGYGSSANAEMPMIRAAQKAGVTHTVLHATVAKNGHVSWRGRFKAGDYHPIVAVQFTANRDGDYHTTADWAKNVITGLQKTYHITRFNLVGHSMGNMAMAFYLLKNAQNSHLPQLQRQVDIAGHFNGILGMNDEPNQMKLTAAGKPTKMDRDYQQLLALRQRYPRQARVLNIYGDLNNGTHSDGRVSNASSKSLRYLVANRAQSYQEHRIVGPNAQHSKLHDNAQVNRLLIKFLWQK
ncbi:cell surface hydrolase [Levilactobacillus acidifarinae DSM 19394]|uniref:Cell surface hydrolase n=2 Tax=Levilactobacillus acidifarinae TaxID=267364 RepID=A0A0R1LN57_9LACO|nr:alpha/beta hydrolase [Levilactobacillus acidifarinae]KRK94516.1 cell surface hydrolase [Levilactobacillus acidifarinae DSM 19394]